MKNSIDFNLKLYHQMLRIRLVEEAIAEAYPHQRMRTPVHLSIGQEATAVASGMALKNSDYAVSTHRSHAHYLAKGGSLNAMLAEIHGKVTGCSRGRGGSMHLIDQRVGFMGSTAIVSNTIPVGVGLGLAIQLEKTDQISCVFLGDGAVEEGVFYESLNFAVIRKLPLLFICENNSYSVYTPIQKRQPPHRKIHELARAIGAYSFFEDGNDVLAAYETILQATNMLRSGTGPCFVELLTYRWREHCGPNYDNELGYRSISEFEQWVQKDPLVIHKKYLIDKLNCKESELSAIRYEVESEIAQAFQFANTSPYPDTNEGLRGEYSETITNIWEREPCEI